MSGKKKLKRNTQYARLNTKAINVMAILLNIIYIIASIFYLPPFLFKGKHRIGFKERLGIYSADVRNGLKNNRFNIWIHAVSVGEIKTAAVLIEQLRFLLPEIRFLISTITPTGNAVARQIASKDDLVIYFPFDLSWIVKKSLCLVNPQLLLIMETELWPNMIAEAHKRKIPIVIANGRISDKAFPNYKRAALFFRATLKKIDLLCMQTENDTKRVIYLGARKQNVQVVGNMKFDQIKALPKSELPDIGLQKNERLIVAGSTHNNEEEIIARVFLRLKQKHKNIRLLICPRHTHRAADIQRMLKGLSLESVLISQMQRKNLTLSPDHVYVLDVMGILREFYQLADIVFIGGSLIKHGGQNLIEPAQSAKAIIFGKYMFNFHEIKTMFLSNQAALCVESEEELFQRFDELLQDENKRAALSRRAQELVRNNQGSAQRIIRLLEENKFLNI